MTDQRERPDSSGPVVAIVVLVLLVALLIGGALIVVYRQARQARELARAHEAIAQQREQEVRQMAQMQMKTLADLEEKEAAARPEGQAPDGQPEGHADKPAPDTDPARIAQLHTDLGNSYLLTGNREKAVEQFRDAAEVLKKAFGEDDPRVRAAEDRLKTAENPGG